MTYWTTQEEELVKECIPLGATYKEIADFINEDFNTNRTKKAVQHRVLNLGLHSLNLSKIKSIEQYNKEIKYKNIICIGEYLGAHKNTTHKCLKCDNIYEAMPKDILVKATSGCSKCNGGIKFTHSDYLNKLHKIKPDIEVLDIYKGTDIKIRHKSSTCGHIFIARPHHVLKSKYLCPKCAKYGFNNNKPGQCYFIYFPQLDLYKIGISNNYCKRLKLFGYRYDLLKVWSYVIGNDARFMETYLHKKYSEYNKITDKLKSGFSETFILPYNIVKEIIDTDDKN